MGAKKANSKLDVVLDQLRYNGGLGNEFATEAEAGALPIGQNSPQKVPFGLHAEQVSGSAFTAPRHSNRRSWIYRIRPSVVHEPYRPIERGLIRSGPFNEVPASPNQLRWDPIPIPKKRSDFVSGLTTMAGNGGSDMHARSCLRRQ